MFRRLLKFYWITFVLVAELSIAAVWPLNWFLFNPGLQTKNLYGVPTMLRGFLRWEPSEPMVDGESCFSSAPLTSLSSDSFILEPKLILGFSIDSWPQHFTASSGLDWGKSSKMQDNSCSIFDLYTSSTCDDWLFHSWLEVIWLTALLWIALKLFLYQMVPKFASRKQDSLSAPCHWHLDEFMLELYRLRIFLFLSRARFMEFILPMSSASAPS